MAKKVGFIGFGQMAEALAKGIITAELIPRESVFASDPRQDRLEFAESKLGIRSCAGNREVVENTELVFIAVKPQNIAEVLEDIKPYLTPQHLIISIAAGITLCYMESILPETAIIRVMPNTACLVGEMAAGFSAGARVRPEDTREIKNLLESCGRAFMLKEDLLDAVTALSGSGPAFVAYIIKALAEGAVRLGLPEETSRILAAQTVFGTGKLLLELDLKPEQLIKMVSSPGGTTVEGFKVIESSDLRDILMKTLEAAARRSRELGAADE